MLARRAHMATYSGGNSSSNSNMNNTATCSSSNNTTTTNTTTATANTTNHNITAPIPIPYKPKQHRAVLQSKGLWGQYVSDQHDGLNEAFLPNPTAATLPPDPTSAFLFVPSVRNGPLPPLQLPGGPAKRVAVFPRGGALDWSLMPPEMAGRPREAIRITQEPVRRGRGREGETREEYVKRKEGEVACRARERHERLLARAQRERRARQVAMREGAVFEDEEEVEVGEKVCGKVDGGL